MVSNALERLREEDVVDLDEERKAQMVSNLLVVLCGDRAAQPVVNTGTLYGRAMAERKKLLLRLDPPVYDAVARWAADDLRSVNAQIEYALRLALRAAGRAPKGGAPDRPEDAGDGPSTGSSRVARTAGGCPDRPTALAWYPGGGPYPGWVRAAGRQCRPGLRRPGERRVPAGADAVATAAATSSPIPTARARPRTRPTIRYEALVVREVVQVADDRSGSTATTRRRRQRASGWRGCAPPTTRPRAQPGNRPGQREDERRPRR